MGQKPQVLQGQGGFTLIELMVTIAVLAIVVTIAAPSFTTMIHNNQSVALGEELVTAINFARAEAVKRGDNVSICASSDGTTCGGNWTQGWIVVADNASGAAAPNPDGNPLRAWEAPNGNAVITVTPGFIRFTRLGTRPRTAGAGDVTITSSVTGCGSNAARTITVGLAGLINSSRSDCQ
ncbi:MULTISPECIES: GspH/FimT family pseudopilin [unclassified Microbulbifer]|uniref:GspH/FimT family pseudopilin n=1 Tax=unclassified Microbulbifer TaxID=2619833 RepID=UPI0027E4A92D|nr:MULTISPECIES: GspH/FimT family pseudopilin [unclassified Microbulbifer]